MPHCRKSRRCSEKVEWQIQRQDTGTGVYQEGKKGKGLNNYCKRMVEGINHGIFSHQIYKLKLKHLQHRQYDRQDTMNIFLLQTPRIAGLVIQPAGYNYISSDQE